MTGSREGADRISSSRMASSRMVCGPAMDRAPLALPGMCIGLLGGSFNPPHAAHRQVSEIALKRLGLDRVWWLVSPGNPLKSKAELAPLKKRLAAARALVQHPRIDVTGLEAALGSPYTVDTLRYLKRRYPSVQFVWLMGADALAELHRWRGWRDIMALVPAAAIDRPGWRLKARAGRAAHHFARAYVDEADAAGLARLKPPAWTLLTVPLSALSSTALRARPDEPGNRS